MRKASVRAQRFLRPRGEPSRPASPHPLVVCPVGTLVVPLLKDKLRHIKNIKILFEQKWMQIGWHLNLNPASVPCHRINLGDRVLGEVEKFYCFARQRGPQRANALKTVCPNLERLVRRFTVIVQRGRDQLLDILLIGWW